MHIINLNWLNYISRETENQENTNFEPEEVWECNSYSETTGLFDPKGNTSIVIHYCITYEHFSGVLGDGKNVLLFYN